MRRALIQDITEGGTLKDFRAAVEDALGASALGEGHIQTVYRNNVSAANTNGLMEILKDDLVRDEFPYLAYYAIHDARARPEHLAMEELGLDKTNVYRANDPIWQEFLTPWDFG